MTAQSRNPGGISPVARRVGAASLAHDVAVPHTCRMTKPFAILFGLTALCACNGDTRPASDTTSAAPAAATASTPALGLGEAMLPVTGGRIWYKVSGTGTGTPVILIHGGPGMGSFYLKSMEGLGVATTMVFAAAVSIIGGIVSHFLAPETKGLVLSEASGGNNRK